MFQSNAKLSTRRHSKGDNRAIMREKAALKDAQREHNDVGRVDVKTGETPTITDNSNSDSASSYPSE